MSTCTPLLTLLQARGADAVAWLHQGTAHRLALDMGLNFDGTFGLGSMSAEEVGLRRQIYWALYCTDKLHATYSGRVCTMLVSSIARLQYIFRRVKFNEGGRKCKVL